MIELTQHITTYVQIYRYHWEIAVFRILDDCQEFATLQPFEGRP